MLQKDKPLRPYRMWYLDKPHFDVEAMSMMDAIAKACIHFKPSKRQRHMVHGVLLDVTYHTQLG